MKKTLFALAAGSLLATSAFAQSSVTLYGVADVSIRYESNTNTSTDHRVRMTDGAISQSRWGMKGVEDLGGGLKGIFRLENGFSLDTGRQNDSNSFFNRMAYVGLQGAFGTVTMGRQHSVVHDFLLDFDPLTVGNYDENAFYAGYYPLRINNQVKYAGKFGGLSVAAGYGFGEVAGNTAANQHYGASASYAMGPFALGGAYQQTKNNVENKLTNWVAGATFATGAFKAAAGYQNHKNDLFSFATETQKNSVWYAGLTYNVTPALALTGAGYYDRLKLNDAGVNEKGKRYTLVALAEYSLSKRTQVYGTVDYTKVKDASLGDLNDPGKIGGTDDKRTNVGVGIRHVF